MDKNLYLRVERLERKTDELFRRSELILDLVQEEVNSRNEQLNKIVTILEKFQEWMESNS